MPSGAPGHILPSMISLLMALAMLTDPVPTTVTRYESVATPQPADGNPPDNIALAADSFDRMTVPVRLGGQGPFLFLVDTGADRTAISSELAGKLGLVMGPRALLHSATGESHVAMAVIDDLTLGRTSVRRIEAPLLAAADIGADGILGIDSLRAQRLLFDFSARTLSMTTSRGRDELSGEDVIIVRAQRREGRLVVTDAAADGKHVSVVIDTGSQYSIGNAALRRTLERHGRIEVIGPVELLSVTGASLRGELVIVRELEIGRATITHLALVVADAHTFHQLDFDRSPAILLGMNGLRSFDKVSIDFETRKLRLMVTSTR